MIPFSVCTIIKNEEKHLERFLDSIRSSLEDYPHEIVIVDTGSDDSSLKILDGFISDNPRESITCGKFDWTGDFSEAKNHAVSLAHNDWILVLDADEYLVGFDRRCIEMMDKKHLRDAGYIDIINNTPAGRTFDKVLRLFNRRYYHFEGIVHEQLVRSDSKNLQGGSLPSYVSVPIKIDHYGYMGTSEEIKAKVLRNNQLLFKMIEETPEDPYLYFQLGQSFSSVKDYENAYEYYGKGLEYEVDERLSYVQQMVVGYGYAMLETGREEEALSFEGIYENFCNYADFLCLMGHIYLKNGLFDKSYKEFEKATKQKDADVEGTNSFLAFYNMAVIDEAMGNIEKAVSLYKKCGEYAPAKERLVHLKK